MLYLDNAATSFPKAPGVGEAVLDFLTRTGASAGRSGHRLAREADAILWEARTLVANLLGFSDPHRVAFCLNVTQALNIALMGILRERDHVVTTSMEHNSVMRPLTYLQQSRGIRLTVVPSATDGQLAAQDLLSRVTPRTRLIVMTHASNVTGGIMPVSEVSRGKGNALLLVDAAQTAGAYPVHMEAMGIDLLAFTGHKALLAPPGIGGLCVGPRVEISPLIRGGTGTVSESLDHPTELPQALEAGTQNMVGAAGLRASLLYLLGRGVENIGQDELHLTRLLMQGLREIPRLRVYGPSDPNLRVPVFSFNFPGLHPGHLATIMEEGYGLLVRAGLHCASSAHRTLGTLPEGTVRISLGPFHKPDDMETILEGLREISKQIPR